jgi:hypothetical protein
VPKREIVPFILAAIGGIGGLVGTLIWSEMLDVVNRHRSPNDQIPFALVSWSDFINYWPIRRRPILREFRRLEPESRLHRWYVASLIWMFFFAAIAFAALVRMSR